MAVTVLKNVSQDEINWYHESRYWIHVSDEKTRTRAATERGLAEGMKKGLAEGRAEGIALTKEETAINFLKMKTLSVEQIAQGVGLSVAEVQKLSENKKE